MFPKRGGNYNIQISPSRHPIRPHETIRHTIVQVLRRNSDSEGKRVHVPLNHLHLPRLQILDVQIVELLPCRIHRIREKPIVSTSNHVIHRHRSS